MNNQVHSENHPIVIKVEVFLNALIEMVWNGRKVCIQFAEVNEGVHITEAFLLMKLVTWPCKKPVGKLY